MAAFGKNPDRSSAAEVREMAASDIPAISSILHESPAASSWSEGSLRESLQSGIAWVAEEDGGVIGFLIGRAAADEFEILNLAVAEFYRRRGVATRLLETMAAWLRKAGTRRVFLEVRASNEAAMALYVRNGFKPCGRRFHYYQNPVEDAIQLFWNTYKTL